MLENLKRNQSNNMENYPNLSFRNGNYLIHLHEAKIST